MEKAILKTLIYADIFDYPLKAWEIHKWLVSKKSSLRQVEKSLKRLEQRLVAREQKGFYFLSQNRGLVKKRLEREKQSKKLFKQAKFISGFFRLIPWIKLVGISGSLAMENVKAGDDIDLFIVTSKNRLWISRLFLLLILELLGKRRKRQDTIENSAGKICINILLEEDNLAQSNKNIYIAHEVLQMRPLWSRDGIYQRYLEDNEWVFKFLPNWTSASLRDHVVAKQSPKSRLPRRPSTRSGLLAMTSMVDLLEKPVRWLQLRYMGKPTGLERISATALYLHPVDNRERILNEYIKRLKKLGVSTS